jgi:glycolate oxidase iron-sulfur subunit
VTWSSLFSSIPARTPAVGAPRLTVGLLTGCVQRLVFPRVNAATVNVLSAEGCDVLAPPDQGCCGALALHAGRRDEARAFARRTIEVFERAGVERIAVNAAGCGSSMKEYADLLADDPAYADRAAGFAASVRDVTEILTELGPVAPRHPLPVTAAYHDACHLAHAQRITREPRELLRAIPELNLVEVSDPGTCCGSAGVYNLLQPAAATELGAGKAESVAATGASLLISANPGCSLQIASARTARGQDIAVAHTAEVLDASIRGRPLRTLLG